MRKIFLFSVLSGLIYCSLFIPFLAVKAYDGLPNAPLVMFYSEECPHCHRMLPLVKALEVENRIAIAKLEVVHHPKNLDQLMGLQNAFNLQCQGHMMIPAFYNHRTKKLLCGEQSYSALKLWATE